ncbi:macrophage mannose receptor 1-like [Asterias amurensis]|uniref:macrophage mannose receptor 1-like n=1 Tax=Asterias amurensis TaxID=7602 RepID=UPI003AB49452
MRVFTVAIWLAFVGHTLGTCPPVSVGQYFQLDDWCYIAQGMETPLSFKDANADCKTLGSDGTGSLVVITAQQTQSLLSAMLGYMNKRNAWIGLSQKLLRPFKWVDGTSLSYTNWAPTEPNGFGIVPGIGIDCVEIVNDILHPGSWYDVPCLTENAYICQVKAVDATIVPPISTECPLKDYTNFFSSCYRLYLDPKTFDEAQKTCQKDSAIDSFLATTDLGYENALLEFLIYRQGAGASSVWIGLQKNTTTAQFKWLDDYPVVFTNWGVNQPDSSNTERACTKIVTDSSSASWDDTTCDTKLPFFCKFRIGGHRPPVVTEPPTTGNCPSGWEKYGSDCYLFQSSNPKVNQNRAQYNCYLNYGSQLVTIHSTGQNDFISKKSKEKGYSAVWIGLERNGNGGFRWQDDSPLDFENWANKQPDVPLLQQCVKLYPDLFGHWKDELCFTNANSVCMMPQYQDGQAPNSTICPTNSDWILNGDYCYMFSEPIENSGYSWQDSQEWCNKHAGHLASIENQAEQDFLNELHFQLIPDFWIGLKETSNNSYTWSDGSAYSFQFWDEGEPNDFNGAEQCVELNMWKGGKWNDVNCGVKQSYICKKPKDAISSVATPTDKPLTGGCPDGWFQTITKCYKVFGGPSNQKTRTEAQAECKKHNNGNLAIILNSGEQALLSSLMESDSESLWIGLSNIGSPNGQYQWSDGSKIDYTNWDRGQPQGWNDPDVPQNDCVRMMNSPHNPGKWSNVFCYIKSGFACTTDSSPDYPYQEIKFETTCSNKDYLSFHGSCFKYDTTKRTYDEAVDFCKADGTSIASIRDGFDDSISVVLLYVHQLTDAWIGLRKNSFTEVYEWGDGWPYLYTNWAPGQPSWTGANHGCVSLGREGYWYDRTCSGTEKHATICKEAQVPPPTTPVPIQNGECPDDWIAWGSSCYFFETKMVDWDTASYFCQSERSGSLVSIHSFDENNFILNKSKNALTGDYMWIRMRREKDGFLDWANGPLDLVNYANWANQEPNGASIKEDCMQMSLKQNPGKWRDTSCKTTASYLCKRPQIEGTKPKPQTGALPAGSIFGIVIGCLVLVAAICGGIAAIFVLRGQSTGRFSFGQQDTTGIVNEDSLQ